MRSLEELLGCHLFAEQRSGGTERIPRRSEKDTKLIGKYICKAPGDEIELEIECNLNVSIWFLFIVIASFFLIQCQTQTASF